MDVVIAAFGKYNAELLESTFLSHEKAAMSAMSTNDHRVTSP